MKLLTSKLVLIPLGIVAAVVFVVVAVSSGGGDSAPPKRPEIGSISAKDLRVGDCITDATSTKGDVTTFDLVPCARRHDGEVYTLVELEGSAYPGVKFVSGKGLRGCRARLRRQLTDAEFASPDLGYKFVYPTTASWAQGDREITCVATFKSVRTVPLAQRTTE